jgi:hypothetical protein
MTLLSTGIFRNYNDYANLWIAKKAALTSIHANGLDTSPLTALLIPSPPPVGSTEASTSFRAGFTSPVTLSKNESQVKSFISHKKVM